MAIESSPLYRLDPQLARAIQSRSARLLHARKDCPQLEVSLVYRSEDVDGKWTLREKPRQAVNDVSALRRLQAQQEAGVAQVQLYTIRHNRSWTPLNISYELFQELLLSHNVFRPFLRTTLTFGRKVEENEYGFPPFRSQSSQSSGCNIEELTYVIRRVERHGRDDPNHTNPWSIRQTGVYHKLTDGESFQTRSTFIVLAPSPAVNGELSNAICGNISVDDRMRPAFSVHERLVADSLRGWMEYMAWLEKDTKLHRNRVVVSDIDERKIYFNAKDRQQLKMHEDLVADMQVILQTMANTISRIGEACQHHCERACRDGSSCSCRCMIQEFEEYAAETQQYLERAHILMARVQSTAHLLADLLAYDETRALKHLAEMSQEESQNIMALTRRSVEDAAAVKILTIISLFYLPLTSVTNFFSTQFVTLNEEDHLHISHDAWYLAAVAVPLTVGTLSLWWLSLLLSRSGKAPWMEKIFQITPVPEDVEQGTPVRHRRALTFALFRSWTGQSSPKAE